MYFNENQNELIEKRSYWLYKKVKPVGIFIHTINFKHSFFNYFKRKNSIYQISFFNLFAKDADHFTLKIKFFIFVLKFLKIKKIYILDDIRHAIPLIKACNYLNIQSVLYMHGQIYDDYIEIINSSPSKYLVWNLFFLKIAKNFYSHKKTKFINIGYRLDNYKKFKSRYEKRINNILFLQEFNFQLDRSENFDSLISKNYTLFYKLKKDINLPKNINKNFTIIDKNISIFECIDTYNIDLVIGISSNALFECYLLNTMSLSIAKNNELLSKYQKQYDVCLNVNKFKSLIDAINEIDKNYIKYVTYYKKRLWSKN